MNDVEKCAQAVKMKLEGYTTEAIAVALSVPLEDAFTYSQGKVPKYKKIGTGNIPAGTKIYLPKKTTPQTSSPYEKNSTVKCNVCGKTESVNFAYCMMKGWPICCGYTMTLISKPSDKIIDHAVCCCIGNATVECAHKDGAGE